MAVVVVVFVVIVIVVAGKVVDARIFLLMPLTAILLTRTQCFHSRRHTRTAITLLLQLCACCAHLLINTRFIGALFVPISN